MRFTSRLKYVACYSETDIFGLSQLVDVEIKFYQEWSCLNVV